MPVCGLFHVRSALEILGNFTGAAMHTPRPRWVKTSNPQSEQMWSGLASIVLQKSFCTGDQKFCGLQARLSCKDVRDLIASR
jgi:hypothetical protein